MAPPRTKDAKADGAPPAKANGANNAAASVDKDQLLKFYRDMLLIRRFEERGGPALWHGADRRLLPPSTSARRPWRWACSR